MVFRFFKDKTPAPGSAPAADPISAIPQTPAASDAKAASPAWLAACWVNYRNLYLMQVNGKEWCDKYLRSITPTEITFS